jgi:hypothetical protein
MRTTTSPRADIPSGHEGDHQGGFGRFWGGLVLARRTPAAPAWFAWEPMPIAPGLLLAVAVAAFAPPLSHAGILFTGWEHGRAATAQGVIAIVLAFAGISARRWPQRARHNRFCCLGLRLPRHPGRPFHDRRWHRPANPSGAPLARAFTARSRARYVGLVTTWHKRSEGPP